MEPGWRERRDTFGEVAGLYDEHRPGYPRAVFDDILRLTDVGPRSEVLEVGAGTGKATVELADRGLRLVALEPDPRMAEVLRRNTRRWEAVRIEENTFEAHAARDGTYDLVVSAQAWHWVEPEVGLAKAADLLTSRGSIAILWNSPVDRGGVMAGELDAVYEQLVPDLVTQWAGSTEALTPTRWGRELGRSPRFGRVQSLERRWPCTYTTRDYVDLLRTHSTHRSLDRHRRRRLLGAVAEVVDRHGGEIAVTYRCQLYVAPVERAPPVR